MYPETPSLVWAIVPSLAAAWLFWIGDRPGQDQRLALLVGAAGFILAMLAAYVWLLHFFARLPAILKNFKLAWHAPALLMAERIRHLNDRQLELVEELGASLAWDIQLTDGPPKYYLRGTDIERRWLIEWLGRPWTGNHLPATRQTSDGSLDRYNASQFVEHLIAHGVALRGRGPYAAEILVGRRELLRRLDLLTEIDGVPHESATDIN